MNKILLDNKQATVLDSNLYYPRLQVNTLGEIVLAISKEGSLTKGILVGKIKDSKSPVPIGKKFDDWEVCGELTDYDGEVIVAFQNEIQAS